MPANVQSLQPFDSDFSISFKFNLSAEHYGGMVGFRVGGRQIAFVVRNLPEKYGNEIFGAFVSDGENTLVTFSGGQPTFKVEKDLELDQDYSVDFDYY